MEKKTSKFLRGEILSSICYIVLGLCLVLIPDQTVNIICKVVFGLVMIAAGIYHIVIYAAEKEKATVLDLFTGVIAAVLGVISLAQNSHFLLTGEGENAIIMCVT